MISTAAVHIIAQSSSEETWWRSPWVPLALGVGGLLLVAVTSHRWRRRAGGVDPSAAMERSGELGRPGGAGRSSGRVHTFPAAGAGFESRDRGRGEKELGELMIELDQLAREIHGRLDTQFAKLEAVIRDADERIDRLNRLLRASRNQPELDVTVHDRITEFADPGVDTEGGLHADVYRLADAGKSLLEISEQTGRPRGELELILALRRARQRSSAASILSES